MLETRADEAVIDLGMIDEPAMPDRPIDLVENEVDSESFV